MSLTPPISVHISPFQELWGGSGPWLPSGTTVVRNLTQCGACPPALLTRPGNLVQQPRSLPALLNQRESPTPTPESLSSPVPGLRFSIREAQRVTREFSRDTRFPSSTSPPLRSTTPRPTQFRIGWGGGGEGQRGGDYITFHLLFF